MTSSIIRAVEAAEEMADVDINSAFVSITGNHIKGLNSSGSIPITHEENEINSEHIERVIEAAKAVSIPMDRMILKRLSSYKKSSEHY